MTRNVKKAIAIKEKKSLRSRILSLEIEAKKKSIWQVQINIIIANTYEIAWLAYSSSISPQTTTSSMTISVDELEKEAIDVQLSVSYSIFQFIAVESRVREE